MRNEHSAAEKIKEISGTNPLKCMKCGKCSATCPSFNEMDIKPHQFVSYVVNEDMKHLSIQNLSGNVFPALPAWSVAQEM